MSSCRSCRAALEYVFVDLGMSPLANSILTQKDLLQPESFYPLRALVCSQCFLVQLEEYESPASIFSDYAYFSSYSTTWLDHAARYAEDAVERFGLGRDSFVVEVASNDGYLLQYFMKKGIPVLGIEPATNVAQAALEKGIPTEMQFFGFDVAAQLARQRRADLLVANNVLAHVPDLDDFVGGIAMLLSPEGTATLEFPHLLRLIEDEQFDTIYHEHLSYFSVLSVERVFAQGGLIVTDVEELPTHGGSLRIHVNHDGSPTPALEELRRREEAAGLSDLVTYGFFGEKVRRAKRDILSFFIDAKEGGLRVAGYGAPAKGNTLLNYTGIGRDFIDYTVDLNPHKQGCFLPGTHIPILAPEALARTHPDLVFVLPWNLQEEIIEQMRHVLEWGGKFVTRMPELRVYA